MAAISAFARNLTGHATSLFALPGGRTFYCGAHVVLEGSGRVGFVKSRSNSGKTFVCNFGDIIERHDFEALRLWRPKAARVFINGDSMPKQQTIQWLEALCRCHPDISIWKAIGSSCEQTANNAAKKFSSLPGISPVNVHVAKARSGTANAADALLTALFGRYSQTGSINYILSNDKKWFSELPYIFSDVPTTLRTFADLGKLEASWNPSRWPNEWAKGTYVVTNTAAVSVGLRIKSRVIGELGVGSRVEVAEIRQVEKDARIRGRIKDVEEGNGWISLWDTQQRHAWALPSTSC
mmetsp:Transcript_28330/g.78197  ORF Transcript_28330/g.78197 Transcript_28330/m.78197 type:complete len:295 (+) Transcript_28330:134-1018(+)|eukprot:CAMPEP_0117527982 /NCGR_PEP_ID=MMETSP0784-20121206/37080_1 /TAXON_ID=39447 /ORGANISM="" /LENGTH=294 /DNA_ID=CAMNT_0005324255 /DNA_START=131 /DNA_END=1015 /DNA_ORIENTATION=+